MKKLILITAILSLYSCSDKYNPSPTDLSFENGYKRAIIDQHEIMRNASVELENKMHKSDSLGDETQAYVYGVQVLCLRNVADDCLNLAINLKCNDDE